MSRSFFALVLALSMSSGCVNAPAFTLTITNTGEDPSYLSAGESTGVLVRLEEQVVGQWVPLSSSAAFLCAPQCGVPGAIVCADAAAELSVAHALLPGDSVEKAYDQEFWYLHPTQQCAQQSGLKRPLRATVFHGPEAQDQNGQTLDAPAESGPMGFDSFVPEPREELFALDLSQQASLTLSIEE